MKALFEKGKYPEIDGLRACAILLVVMTHIFQSMPGLSYVSHSVEWMTPLFNGWIGVDLFFVLSGFLIGGQILNKIEAGEFSVGSFYLRRAFRILPAYFAVLLFLIAVHLFSEKAYSILVHDPFKWKGFIMNFLLLTDYFPYFPGIGSWSLSIEEQFYWLIPCLLMLLSRSTNQTNARFFLCIWGGALLFRMCIYRHYDLGPEASLELVQKVIYFPFHTRMDGLAAGVLACMALKAGRTSANPVAQMISRGIGFVMTGFVLLTGGLKGWWFETTLQYSLLSAGFGLLLWGVLAEDGQETSSTVRILRHSFWTPIARLSYSIYLIHTLTISLVNFFFHQAGMVSSWFKPPAMLGVTMCASLGLFFIVENPIHEWAKAKFR